MTSKVKQVMIFVLALTGFHHVFAQEKSVLPAFKQQRAEEDYRFLQKDSTRKNSPWKSVKYIPLTPSGDSYLSIGGDMRIQYDYVNNNNWGDGPEDNNGYLLKRYMLHTDWHLGNNVRVFGQLMSGIELGKAGGPELPDENHLDLHQAFIELKTKFGGTRELALRAGRQEFAYGSSRLVSVRDINVRQSFDAVKLIFNGQGIQLDAFASRPVQTKRGIFDDVSSKLNAFWGLYLVSALPSFLKSNIDIYYFGLDKKSTRFEQGAGEERRHSVGMRFWSSRSRLRHNSEIIYQFGNFGNGNISAWTVSSRLSYQIDEWALQPEFDLKTEIISGDRNALNAHLQTFNPLFPNGSYFGWIAQIGPVNLMDIHPSVRLNVRNNLAIMLDWDFLWRHRSADGLYTMPYILIRSGQETREKYIGDQITFTLDWRVNRHITFETFITYFRAGDFLRATGNSRNITFIAPRLSVKF